MVLGILLSVALSDSVLRRTESSIAAVFLLAAAAGCTALR